MLPIVIRKWSSSVIRRKKLLVGSLNKNKHKNKSGHFKNAFVLDLQIPNPLGNTAIQSTHLIHLDNGIVNQKI